MAFYGTPANLMPYSHPLRLARACTIALVAVQAAKGIAF